MNQIIPWSIKLRVINKKKMIKSDIVTFVPEKYNRSLTCNGVSRDYPVKEQLYRCDMCIEDFNIRFDSGDT